MKSTFLSALTCLGLVAAAPAFSAEPPAIAGIVFQGDQFMKSLHEGMRTGAKAGGAKLLETNVEGKQEREAEAVDTYVTRGVKAIVIAPLSATNSVAALERAKAKGVVIVTVNSSLAKEGIASASFETANIDLGRTSGKAAAEFIKARLGGQAKVAILGFKSLLPEQSGARSGGFKEEVVKGNKADVVTEQDAWLPEKAVSVATDILTAHPEVNVIYACNEGGTVGAIQAVRNAGKAGKVFVFGIDGSEQLAKALLSSDDVLQATTAQSPALMGRQGVEAALKAIEKKEVTAHITVPTTLLSRGDKAGVQAFLTSITAGK
jgi:ABC-type sugar transport system substrate-binding protein